MRRCYRTAGRQSCHGGGVDFAVTTQPTAHPTVTSLIHLLEQGIDVLFPITQVTTLDVMLELPCSEATCRVGKLEGPQEVAGLLEVGTNGEDFVDQILHADDAILTQVVFNELVVGKSNALLVDLAIAALVDQLTDRLEVGIAVGDVGVDNSEHLLCSLGKLDEDAVVDLEKTKELKDLARLGSDLVDTESVSSGCVSVRPDLPLDANNEDKLGLLLNIERSTLSAQASESDLLPLCISVLLDVGLGTLKDGLALLLVCLSNTMLAAVW